MCKFWQVTNQITQFRRFLFKFCFCMESLGTQRWNQESPYIQFCNFNMKLEKFRSIRISYLMVKAGHHHSPHLIYQTAVDMPNVAQLGWNQHNSAWLPISILLLIAKTDEKRAVNLLFPSHSTVQILFCPKSIIPKFSQFTINFEFIPVKRCWF